MAISCTEQHGLLLTVRAREGEPRVASYDLRVKVIGKTGLVLERLNETIAAGRDISAAGEELKLAVELPAAGNYLVHILARPEDSAGMRQFALRDFAVDGVQKRDLELVLLLGDLDGDGFPPCGPPSWLQCGPTSCQFLDCNDSDPAVHPFGQEQCGNGEDDDCSAGCGAAPGQGDAVCEDQDGDGVAADKDCDDSDPCRSGMIPEYRNTCVHKTSEWDAPATKACRDKQGASFKPPLCGDGVDNDCDGKDVSCFVDADCDGYAPPNDCDDTRAAINPGATEACDGVDNNCNGAVDEGCLPCDVDGDQHALKNTSDPSCSLPADDPDDYDSGIHPGTSKDDGGKEGGTIRGALRGTCSSTAEKDGVASRDVDHDGDGVAAKDDGCPPASCDQDGDGFEGAQCSPPASSLDCDDGNAQVFPGAPDSCGDSIAQDCVADVSCSCDMDGDGYCPPTQSGLAGDCNDGDADIHPWAVEKCDRVDNDCDGLVDEGNPDSTGTLVSTSAKQCNDDNDGKCGVKEGVCICSPLTPMSKRDGTNRVACPGEDLSKPASLRCFGATQPQMERCDGEDWSCDGLPYASGEAFLGQGATCGVDQGVCVAGMVESCNPSASVDAKILAVFTAAGVTFESGWLCSKGTTLPQAEVCNGRDDDCDGYLSKKQVTGSDPGWAELEENDADGDGYIGCSGCSNAALPAPLKGCGDCDDDNATVYPGAPEQCNGIDDNCAAGTSDDGKDQCQGLTCCPAQKACRNLQTDIKNCGACGQACPAGAADACIAGKCTCGGTPCTAPPCQQASCASGSCDVTDAPNKTACAGGLCYNGSCCTGCWDGKNSCKPGDQDKTCGSGGADCIDCTKSGQVCVARSCATP